MNQDDKNKERRKQKRLGKLGTNHPVCTECGEADWRCFDDHHIAGRAYDDMCVLLCKNCHSKLSDSQNDHPKQIGGKPTDLERIGRFLLGLADLLAALAKKLAEFGHLLIEKVRSTANAGGVQ